MRRFEFVGGTSAKFWEIERVGTTVTVRFGRLGTNGQTQAKDLATDAAAIAHLDKLVAEKVKKGYVETATGSSPAAVAAPAPPAPAAPAPEPVPVPKPAPEPAPAVDEDSWTVPTSWWRLAEPFRGLGPVRTLSLRKNAADQVARVIESTKAKVALALSHPQSDKELVEAAKGYLSGRSPTPLGAAVVATAVTKHCGWGAERDALPSFADDWVATYGMTFAAEAGALLATVRFLDPAQRSPYIGRAPAQDLPVYHVRAILARLRALLAFASDDDYATAVARLGKLRNGPAIQVVCSYLAPTEQQWVDEDLAGSLTGLSGADMGAVMLLVSATTRRQAGKAMKTSTARSRVMYSSEALYSLAANVGPETAADVAGLFDDAGDADTLRRLLSILTQFPTDEAFELLADRVDQKYVEPALLETMERFPRRAFRVLAGQAGGRGRTAAKAKQLLRMHALSHPDLADQVRPDLGEEAAALLGELTTEATVPTAAPGSLPPLLVAPPWTNQRARSRPVVVAVDASPSPLRLVWEPGEQQAWAELDTGDRWLSRTADWRALIQRTVGGYDWRQIAIFAHAPADLVRPLLRSATPHDAWGAEPALRRVLGRFGDEAVAYVARAAFSKPASLAPALLPMEGVEVASRMAEWHARAKSIRPVAARWFDRHAESAARDLLPAALGKPGKARTLAEDALRLLAVRGHDAVVRRAAATHGSEAAGAVDQLLGLDPLEILPARIPDLPSWLFPAHLRPALLKDRSAALPAEAVGHVCTMLAMSKLGESYAGIEVVREALDPPSLADMAWSVFERWGSAGYPSKDGWVLDAQGLVGDDETVRRLAPLIRAWPGEAAHARAVAGLDVLSEIGSDVALMHLHGIAEKAKFKGLKTKAKERMDAVADGLGLTAEQLADRLVPDFGLDADGSVVLDYGPRRFRVGFDEQLKPLIVDEDGARRKVLPKPAAKDDSTLALDAYARFSGLKKDVKTIAADQIRRLERAMVAGRRWTAAEQRSLFVDHPLLWHLARRLVWGTFDQSGSPTGSFRVAEDRTLADSGDEEIHVPDDAAVGIPHPLHLGGAIGAWSDLFADYEILQPFAQLGREVLALTPEERRSRRLTRYEGIKVATGKVLGLSYRGWERGIPQDAGVSHVAYKPVPGGRAVVISLDPGIVAGMAMEFPVQTISEVWLSDGPAEWTNANGDLVFDLLDPITASEALRDLEALRT